MNLTEGNVIDAILRFIQERVGADALYQFPMARYMVLLVRALRTPLIYPSGEDAQDCTAPYYELRIKREELAELWELRAKVAPYVSRIVTKFVDYGLLERAPSNNRNGFILRVYSPWLALSGSPCSARTQSFTDHSECTVNGFTDHSECTVNGFTDHSECTVNGFTDHSECTVKPGPGGKLHERTGNSTLKTPGSNPCNSLTFTTSDSTFLPTFPRSSAHGAQRSPYILYNTSIPPYPHSAGEGERDQGTGIGTAPERPAAPPPLTTADRTPVRPTSDTLYSPYECQVTSATTLTTPSSPPAQAAVTTSPSAQAGPAPPPAGRKRQSRFSEPTKEEYDAFVNARIAAGDWEEAVFKADAFWQRVKANARQGQWYTKGGTPVTTTWQEYVKCAYLRTCKRYGPERVSRQAYRAECERLTRQRLHDAAEQGRADARRQAEAQRKAEVRWKDDARWKADAGSQNDARWKADAGSQNDARWQTEVRWQDDARQQVMPGTAPAGRRLRPGTGGPPGLPDLWSSFRRQTPSPTDTAGVPYPKGTTPNAEPMPGKWPDRHFRS